MQMPDITEALFENKIVLVTGCMASGKTTTLIKAARMMSNTWNSKPTAIRHSLDAGRTNTWESRDGDTWSSELSDNTDDLIDKLAEIQGLAIVDELQFFESSQKLLHALWHRQASHKPTLLGGLNLDYLGKPFETTADVASVANLVVNLEARCTSCNKPARFTWKRPGDNHRIEVGFDQYEPRCYACWKKTNYQNFSRSSRFSSLISRFPVIISRNNTKPSSSI